MRERLRTARQAMQEGFPLPEALWLDWLADEKEGGAEPSLITALYDLAVADYLSIPLWADYVRCVLLVPLLTPRLDCYGCGWARVPATMHGMPCRYVSELALHERSKDSLEGFREVGERALTAGGIHLAHGIQLWGAYRWLTAGAAVHACMHAPPCRHALGGSKHKRTPMCRRNLCYGY